MRKKIDNIEKTSLGVVMDKKSKLAQPRTYYVLKLKRTVKPQTHYCKKMVFIYYNGGYRIKYRQFHNNEYFDNNNNGLYFDLEDFYKKYSLIDILTPENFAKKYFCELIRL